MQPAAEGLWKIFRDLLAKFPAEEAPVMAWPAVCGSTVAARTKAIAFTDGVLWVQVPDRGWKAQLVDFASQYLSGMGTLLGSQVHRIEFVLPNETVPQKQETAIRNESKRKGRTLRRGPGES